MYYLGKHTSISYLNAEHFAQIPYLRDNAGRLPPFVIAVGDRRRVAAAREILRLEEPMALHEYAAALVGPGGRGRVDMLIGVYAGAAGPIPLLVIETQMGMPAVEVVLREALEHCALAYRYGALSQNSDAIYLIRAGTAGGINDGTGPVLKPGDLVNGQFSLGWSGAGLQCLGGLRFDEAAAIAKFKENWLSLGLGFSPDGQYPQVVSDSGVVEALSQAAGRLGVRLHCGGNFSKDSLYAEGNESGFESLRRLYGVLSTEMEQVVTGQVAATLGRQGIKVKCGLVSGVVGLLGEGSFSEDVALPALAERNALLTAAEALSALGYQK